MTAGGGEEAVALAREAARARRPFAVAFVDMRMPGGWDGTRTIRELFGVDPDVQVVVATAYSDRDLDSIGRQFHRNDQLLILKKPFDAVEVRQAASALWVKRRMTEAARVRVEELDREVAARTEQIRRMALRDALTGLPNRQALLESLERLVAAEQGRRVAEGGAAPAPGGGFALLFLDLNGFKLVNDSLGHAVGDQLLRSIAGRIRGLEAGPRAGGDPVRGPITGHRLGGDEFVLLLEGVPGVDAAEAVAAGVIESLRAPHRLGPHSCVSHASIGLVSSFREHLDAGELLRDADLAMFEAKGRGRAAGRPVCVAYEGAMHAAAQRRLTLETDLRAALDADALGLRYQPVRDAADATVTGLEALLRWVHPALGPVENAEILAIAEDTELIHPLGAWVRRAATRDAARLAASPGPLRGVQVHVNVSMRELLDPGFAQRVAGELAAAGLDAGALTLEVSEVGIDRQSDLVAAAIHGLHAEGLAVVLDHFGRERSSLAFLAELPLQAVKVDRYFVSDIGAHPARLQVLQAVVGFARSLGLEACACGIETPEQMAAVQSIGVDGLQGFLMGHPLPLAELDRAEAGGFRLPPPAAAAA